MTPRHRNPELPGFQPYHPAGTLTWDRERYPALGVQDGQLERWIDQASTDERADDNVALLWDELWPLNDAGQPCVQN